MQKKSHSPNSLLRKRMWLAAMPSLVFVAVAWLVFFVDASVVFSKSFHYLGILPRTVRGLKGILFMPLIHNSLSHIGSNTLPLIILLWFTFFFYHTIAFRSVFLLWMLSGFFTWVIGRDAYHVGASGLIFGLVFFLFFSGIFRKYTPLVALSLIVVFLYGSTVWSIFPFSEYLDINISWEGHLAGAVSGLLVAIVFRKEEPQKPPETWDEEDENENDDKNDDRLSQAAIIFDGDNEVPGNGEPNVGLS